MFAHKANEQAAGFETENDIQSFVNAKPKIPLHLRIRTRLILLISLAVFITEILIFVPSIASMQQRWLINKHEALQPFGLMLTDKHDTSVDANVRKSILKATGALAISIVSNDGSTVDLSLDSKIPVVERTINLNTFTETDAILAAITTLFRKTGKTLQVIGPIKGTDSNLAVVIPNTVLRNTLIEFTWHFALISLTIALMAAMIIYLVIYELLVRPLKDIYMNMLDFVMEPDNPSRIIVPGARRDEVGIAQRQVAAIESVLQQNYARQKHLADLGLAVSKINHDMRNVLASAHLMSDHLAEVKDPVVQSLAPKLIRTINRAINYTQSIIAYGRAQEQPPQRRRILLRRLVEDVRETLAVPGRDEVDIRNFVPEDFEIDADNEQLHRVITNLCRNAVQAMTANDNNWDCAVKEITITAGHIGTTAIIDVEDTGPGLPPRAKEHLFAPFRGSAHRDGIGLGLAICLELVRAHGGTIKLLEDGKPGTHFEIRIPDLPASLVEWRRKKRSGGGSSRFIEES